jgi:hypothetical protein
MSRPEPVIRGAALPHVRLQLTTAEEEIMFKAITRTLIAAVVIAAASVPSAVHARVLNPSPRGVAIVLGQATSASPVGRPNPIGQMPQTSDPGARRSESAASVPRCPRVGPCISPYGIVTHGSGTHSVHQTADASQKGFQWDAAAIIATGMLLLLSGACMAAIVTRRRRHHATAS